MRVVMIAMGSTNSGVRLDERKSAGSDITRRAIRRSDRHRGWLRSNFVARERQQADHRPDHAEHLGNVGYGVSALRRVKGANGDAKLAREPEAAAPPDEASLQSLKSWVAVIIGIVIAYQIATLGRQGLWLDEIITVMLTLPERSLTEMYLLSDENPPLYYVLMHF